MISKSKLKILLTTFILFSLSNSYCFAAEFTHSAWIPRWSPVSGEESVKENSELFNGDISPMWYKVNTDGTLYSYIPSNAASTKSLLKKKGIGLVPTVAMFDYGIIHEIFQTQEGFNTHVDSIINEVEKNNYNGIDLDYESILLEDREKFYELLDILAIKLHEKNKKLYITVIAKWDDKTYWLPQTQEVQNWKKLSTYADVIRIMAYEYTSAGSVHPGPIAPLSWHKQILDYAITKVPKSKIEMGIPLYAYQWRRISQPDFFDIDISELIKQRNFNTPGSYVKTGVERFLTENNGKTDIYEGENFYRYQNHLTDGTTEDIVLVYQDRMSIVERENLAKGYGIKGVVYWSLGGDEDLLNGAVVETETEQTDKLVKQVVDILNLGGERVLKNNK